MSLLWPPITTPQLGGVIELTFFEKMIRCGAREKTNIWRPWRQELWKRQRWIGILVNWGCFLQNYELLLGQYSKISNQWNFLGKDTNFDWFIYVMQALNKMRYVQVYERVCTLRFFYKIWCSFINCAYNNFFCMLNL